jgi:protein required for attachment to host cells
VKKGTWIVLADAATARVYEAGSQRDGWTLLSELQHPESRALDSELGSDKPGRVKQAGGSRSAMEPRTPPKKVEIDRFARQLAGALGEGLRKGAYQQLVLVAPPAFLGVLRGHLSERVQARVEAVVEKDYLHIEQREARVLIEGQLLH